MAAARTQAAWHPARNGSGSSRGLGVFLNEFRCPCERLWTDAPFLCRPQQRLALDIPEAGRLVGVVDGQADGSNVLQSLWKENQSCAHSLSVDWTRPLAERRGSAGEQGQPDGVPSPGAPAHSERQSLKTP